MEGALEVLPLSFLELLLLLMRFRERWCGIWGRGMAVEGSSLLGLEIGWFQELGI